MQSKTVDLGCDYITLTTKEGSRYAEWKEAFSFVASEEQARGHKWASARVLGYEGEQSGHAFCGKRDDGAMVRLSSGVAEQYAHLFSPDAAHCTRIDLQVTVEFEHPDPQFLLKAYEAGKNKPIKGGRPPLYTLIKNSMGSSTLYVGSRTSMRFGRVYDKGVEQGTVIAGKLFRWEVEIKDVLADQAIQMLTHGMSYDRVVLSIVGDFFAARSMPVVWIVPPMEDAFSIPRIQADDAGGLRWLAGPVASTFARLMDTVGPEQALRAIFAKCLTESTDSAIIEAMAHMYAEHIANVAV